ncbi:MAG: 4Fe-4S binding protein [Candidatus Woesearchaeota archaeon]
MQNEKIPQKHITKHITLGAHIPYPGNSLDNKTGSWRVMRPIKDPKKCTSCGFCWMFCPDTAITEDFEIKYDYCKGCGICVKACPFGALAMVKEEK